MHIRKLHAVRTEEHMNENNNIDRSSNERRIDKDDDNKDTHDKEYNNDKNNTSGDNYKKYITYIYHFYQDFNKIDAFKNDQFKYKDKRRQYIKT